MCKRKETVLLRVKSDTSAKGLAKSIFATKVKQNPNTIILRGVGAGAVNQMTKAYIIAKGKLSLKNIIPKLDMSFADIDDNITAVEYLITF